MVHSILFYDSTDPGAQVCLVDKRGVSKNLGIYSNEFYVHNHLSMTFSGKYISSYYLDM